MSLRAALSKELRRSRHWVALRRLQHEGFAAAYSRWRLWSRVLALPSVASDPWKPGTRLEVHLVCHQADHLCALWALKSFYARAGVRYPVVVHLSGPFSSAALAHLWKHVPNARFIDHMAANGAVDSWLREHRCSRLRAARSQNAFMLKLVDVAVLSASDHILLLDSDVLFFREPTELLEAAASRSDGWLFQRDAGTTYNVTAADALKLAGIALAPHINTGIAVFPKERLDLQRCEQLLEHPPIARLSGWIEQTLYALLASADNAVSYLPPSYLVSLNGREELGSLVARHYAGPSRGLLTEEGIPYLLEAAPSAWAA